MYMSIEHVAEMLDVSTSTVRRWAHAAGLTAKKRPQGYGGAAIPVRALLNHLALSGKLPFRSIEPKAVTTETRRQYRRTQSALAKVGLDETTINARRRAYLQEISQ